MIQNIFIARSWFVALALPAVLSNYAISQTVSPAATPAPTPYRSTFEGYQAYSDDKLTNWKAANDEVARIGGWREYAKQAQGLELKPENTPATKAGEVNPKAKP